MTEWKRINIPTCHPALTTYQGKVVLVGGKENGHLSNKLLSLHDDATWSTELPPMLTPRERAVAISADRHYLIVVGGEIEGKATAEVELFDGKQWKRAEPFPEACRDMKFALLNGNLYLTAEWISIYSTSMDTLIESVTSSKPKLIHWKRLPRTSFLQLSIVALKGHLLAVGGGQPPPRGKVSHGLHYTLCPT